MGAPEPPAISAGEIKNVRNLVEKFGSKTNENITQVTEGLKKLLQTREKEL